MSVDCDYVRHFSNSPNASCHFVKTNADCQDVGGFINYVDVSRSSLFLSLSFSLSPPPFTTASLLWRVRVRQISRLNFQSTALLLQFLLFTPGRHLYLPRVAVKSLHCAGHRGRRLLLPQPRGHIKDAETLPERRRSDHFGARKWGTGHILVSRRDTTGETW